MQWHFQRKGSQYIVRSSTHKNKYVFYLDIKYMGRDRDRKKHAYTHRKKERSKYTKY